jgi:hypothetical protein
MLRKFCGSEKVNFHFTELKITSISRKRSKIQIVFRAWRALETTQILSEALPNPVDSERVIGGDNVDWFFLFIAYIMK